MTAFLGPGSDKPAPTISWWRTMNPSESSSRNELILQQTIISSQEGFQAYVMSFLDFKQIQDFLFQTKVAEQNVFCLS